MPYETADLLGKVAGAGEGNRTLVRQCLLLGQKRKSSKRAQRVRFTPKDGVIGRQLVDG